MRLVERFGETAALDLLPQLRRPQEDFYLSTAFKPQGMTSQTGTGLWSGAPSPTVPT